jgi:predicted secreted Zn-dependent protease
VITKIGSERFMNIEVHWGERNANGRFAVQARDTRSLIRALNAHGEWGRFTGRLNYAISSTGRGVIRKVRLSPSYRIVMPVWRNYRDQPQNVRDDWDQMYRALRAHEDGHRQIFEREVTRLEKELRSLNRNRTADVERRIAEALAVLQRLQDEFDRETEHGAARGVELTIPQD